jgi:hypothetical protein
VIDVLVKMKSNHLPDLPPSIVAPTDRDRSTRGIS